MPHAARDRAGRGAWCIHLLCVLGAGLVNVPLIGQPIDSAAKVSIAPRPLPAKNKLSPPNFRLDVKLVQIPITVTDLRDRPVLGLQKEEFRVFEDGVEQQLATFSLVDSPVSVGLIFDSSASMKKGIESSRAAVDQFLTTTIAEDEFFLVRFSDKAELLTGFTHVADEISRSLAMVRPRGYTAMIDAIWRSIHQMRGAGNPRKILLVLSDGGDNRSRYSESELLSLVRESDVRLYAIGLFERPRYLEKLADETGGRVFWVRGLGELPDVMDRLSRLIRTEYVLGYFPRNTQNDGRYRKVVVQVNPQQGVAKVRATWRRGYPTPDD